MNKQDLITENMNFVYHIIHKHYPSFVKDEDVVGAGMLGLCKAADKWDESKGKFTTLAGHCILNEINTEFRKRKKHSGNLSLDYGVKDRDGRERPFGEFLVGEEDVELVETDKFYDGLTDKERLILDYRKKCYTVTQIGDLIGCSQPTVSRTLKKIRRNWDETIN